MGSPQPSARQACSIHATLLCASLGLSGPLWAFLGLSKPASPPASQLASQLIPPVNQPASSLVVILLVRGCLRLPGASGTAWAARGLVGLPWVLGVVWGCLGLLAECFSHCHHHLNGLRWAGLWAVFPCCAAGPTGYAGPVFVLFFALPASPAWVTLDRCLGCFPRGQRHPSR